jgi:uncharacterized integral membrane protein
LGLIICNISFCASLAFGERWKKHSVNEMKLNIKQIVLLSGIGIAIVAFLFAMLNTPNHSVKLSVRRPSQTAPNCVCNSKKQGFH